MKDFESCKGIVMKKGIRKIIKDVHKYAGRIRERNVCPNCNSLDVTKRITTRDYKCYNCGWVGKGVNKIVT